MISSPSSRRRTMRGPFCRHQSINSGLTVTMVHGRRKWAALGRIRSRAMPRSFAPQADGEVSVPSHMFRTPLKIRQPGIEVRPVIAGEGQDRHQVESLVHEPGVPGSRGVWLWLFEDIHYRCQLLMSGTCETSKPASRRWQFRTWTYVAQPTGSARTGSDTMDGNATTDAVRKMSRHFLFPDRDSTSSAGGRRPPTRKVYVHPAQNRASRRIRQKPTHGDNRKCRKQRAGQIFHLTSWQLSSQYSIQKRNLPEPINMPDTRVCQISNIYSQ